MFERSRRGPIEVVRLAHGKANTLDLEFCRGLADLVRTFVDAPGTAVVITGNDKVFSAGVDLVRLRDDGPRYVTDFVRALEDLCVAVARAPMPVVAAVNGHAIAGGAVLALGCDWRLMADGAGRMGVPELVVGVPFPPLDFEPVRAAVSSTRLRSLVYFGETLGARDALAAGLVDEVVPPDRLLDRAVEVAERLAAIPRVAFTLTKRQVQAPLLRPLAPDVPEPTTDDVIAAWKTPEVRGALAAYVSRVLGK